VRSTYNTLFTTHRGPSRERRSGARGRAARDLARLSRGGAGATRACRAGRRARAGATRATVRRTGRAPPTGTQQIKKQENTQEQQSNTMHNKTADPELARLHDGGCVACPDSCNPPAPQSQPLSRTKRRSRPDTRAASPAFRGYKTRAVLSGLTPNPSTACPCTARCGASTPTCVSALSTRHPGCRLRWRRRRPL
jgi:hypothetical protein